MALDLSLPDRSRANQLNNNIENDKDSDKHTNGYLNTRQNDVRSLQQTPATSSEHSRNTPPSVNINDSSPPSSKPRLERQDSGSGRRLQPARPLALYPTWTNPALYGVHLSPSHPPGSPAFPLPTSPLLTTPIPQSPLTSLSLPASPFLTESLSASLPTSPLFAVNFVPRSHSPAPRSAKSVRFADSDPDLANKRSKDDSTMSWMKWKLLKRQLNDVESETVSSPKRISPDLPRGDLFSDDASSVSTGPGSPRSLPRTPTGLRGTQGGTAFVYPPLTRSGSPKCHSSNHRECKATLAPPNASRKRQEVDDGLPFDPRDWSRDDVHRWLRHMKSVHEIPVHLDRFLMNGKALCLMNLQMFTYRVPLGGKLLYKDFQMRLNRAMQLKNGERSSKSSPPKQSNNDGNSSSSSPTSSASR